MKESTTFNLSHVETVLSGTVPTLKSLLSGLPSEMQLTNEGGKSWSCYDIIGHLIHGEKTDWIPRLDIILNAIDKNFEPFDRFAQERESVGKDFDQLMEEFSVLRNENLLKLKSFKLDEDDFQKEGIHPHFGPVTVENLLSAWAAHDLGHIYQVSRVVAKQFKNQTGPWPEYLRVLTD